MPYRSISGTVPQYSISASGTSADGYWLKFYAAGTTTPINMGTDSVPTATLAKCTLNSRGEPISTSGDPTTVFIPHLNQSYKIVLYATEADADSNTTGSALWVVDNLSLSLLESTDLADYTAIRALNISTIEDGQTITVTDSGIAGDFVLRNSVAHGLTDNGFGIIIIDSDWYAEREENKYIDPAWFGADYTGTVSSHAGWLLAINAAVTTGLPIKPHPGTYLIATSVEKDNFSGLTIDGGGAVVIDFQTDDAFKFGDHSIDGSGFATQTAITCSDIIITGIEFNPVSGNGWSGTSFANARPLSFSSAQNVHVFLNEFHDNHVGAVDFFSPCKDVFIHHNHFESSEEAPATYGPRPFCYVSDLDNLDDATGTLSYSAPTVYHENVNINFNTFQQIGRGIVSWNVHVFDYSNNTFRKPVIRTISTSNWNFDGVISRNSHVAENNTTQTLSTFVNIGVGCKRIKVTKEKFLGTLSGTGVNASLKCVDHGGVSESIEVYDNEFKTVNANVQVNVGPNVGVDIHSNKFHEPSLSTGGRPIVFNESPATTPGFDFPKTRVFNNDVLAGTRFIELTGEPPAGGGAGSQEAIQVYGNRFANITTNNVIVADSTANWDCALWDNDYVMDSTMTYVNNFGAGGIVLSRIDKVEKNLQEIATTGASVTINWRDYGGDHWRITPNVTQDLTDITGEFGDIQELTIHSGGAITFKHSANLRMAGTVDFVSKTNDVVTLCNRSGVWFEKSRTVF